MTDDLNRREAPPLIFAFCRGRHAMKAAFEIAGPKGSAKSLLGIFTLQGFC
jgi:hypothetical protein